MTTALWYQTEGRRLPLGEWKRLGRAVRDRGEVERTIADRYELTAAACWPSGTYEFQVVEFSRESPPDAHVVMECGVCDDDLEADADALVCGSCGIAYDVDGSNGRWT